MSAAHHTAANHAVRAHGLSVNYRTHLALEDVSVDAPAGLVTGLIGPNGSGKSTLLKAMLGLVQSTGTTTFFDSTLDRARSRVGYMPQTSEVDWDFPATVADVVTMGTYGSLGWLRRPGKKEKAIAQDAMERTGIVPLSSRQIGQLSGGQRRRVFLARMLAQRADLYLMDEPFAGIDAASEAAIMDVLRELIATGDKTIVLVHHDLTTVREICQHVALLKEGRLVAQGPTDAVLTREHLRTAYDVMV